MNDHYKDLLRQYLIAVNDLTRYPQCQIKALEARLWEAIGEGKSTPGRSRAVATAGSAPAA